MIPVTKCKRCGRLLTLAESVEVGYGHLCLSKTPLSEIGKPHIMDGQIDIFGEADNAGSLEDNDDKED
jgi:hypothetical protein